MQVIGSGRVRETTPLTSQPNQCAQMPYWRKQTSRNWCRPLPILLFLLTWPCFCNLQSLAIISCFPSPLQHRLNKQSLRFSTCCYAQQCLSSRQLEYAVLPHLGCCVVSPCCTPPNSIASSPHKLHDSTTVTSLCCKQPSFLSWHLSARHKARVIVPSGSSQSTLTGAAQRLRSRRLGDSMVMARHGSRPGPYHEATLRQQSWCIALCLIQSLATCRLRPAQATRIHCWACRKGRPRT
jgi:hypothetical protein